MPTTPVATSPMGAKFQERTIKILLRLIGISGLLAIPAIFLPSVWMNAIHEFLGLGELPSAPIVDYLARSLSAFYAGFSVICLFISCDIGRYRPLIGLIGWLAVALGITLLVVAIAAGLPWWWAISEGPPTILVGLVIARWARSRATESREISSPQ